MIRVLVEVNAVVADRTGEWFLTAAHCVVGSSSFRVLLGSLSRSVPNGDWYDVVAVDVHAGYNGFTHQNDAAFLRLSRPAPYQPLRVIGANEPAAWDAQTPR